MGSKKTRWEALRLPFAIEEPGDYGQENFMDLNKITKKGGTYLDHGRHVCGVMAKLYLDQFNAVEAGAAFPETYLNKADAMRELQYLAERFKVLQFEMTGNPSANW